MAHVKRLIALLVLTPLTAFADVEL
ncbi:uncharacterized protein METZ01_LOCUS276322, partial [marine metagenome]